MSGFTKKQLAAAKFRLLLTVALDNTLSKLAVRAATVIVCKRINFETGAVAHCSMATYCLDLGIRANSSMRDALAELENGGYFTADKKFGVVNRYTIADRFFAENDPEEDDEPRRKTRRGAEQNPAAKRGATPPQNAADTPPQNAATITGKGIPENESRKLTPKIVEGELFPPVKKNEEPARGATTGGKTTPAGKKVATKDQIDDLFERRFWERWPNKVGKTEARKAFEKCWSEIDAIEIGRDRYVATKPPDRNWLNPATFLNQRRWEDQPAPASTLPDSFTNNRRAAPSANSRDGFGFRVMRLVDE